MPTSFKEQLDKITDARQKLAVWETMISYLDENFISKDGRPAKKGILADGCIVPTVPEEVVEAIMDGVREGPIAEIETMINRIETSEVKNAKVKKSPAKEANTSPKA